MSTNVTLCPTSLVPFHFVRNYTGKIHIALGVYEFQCGKVAHPDSAKPLDDLTVSKQKICKLCIKNMNYRKSYYTESEA